VRSDTPERASKALWLASRANLGGTSSNRPVFNVAAVLGCAAARGVVAMYFNRRRRENFDVFTVVGGTGHLC